MNISQHQPNAAIARAHLDHIIKIICGHEFNTPMAAILGFTEFLNTNRAELTDRDIDEYIAYIMQSGNRLNNVSKRLGIWYALTKKSFIKNISFNIALTELLLIIEEQKALFKDRNPQNLINISNCDETLVLTGDQSCFMQAFTELVNNAFKFSLTNTLVHVNFTVQEKELLIKILNLTEMVSEYQLKEYRPFTQFNRQKFEQQGLGIGLEIARLGVEQCGGSFNISGKDNGNISEIITHISLPISSVTHKPA